MKFRAKFEVALPKQSLSVIANHSKSVSFYRKQSKGIRQVYSTEFLNAATIRKAKLDYVWLLLLKIMQWESQNYTPLQRWTTKNHTNSQSQLQNTQLNLLTLTFLAIWKWTKVNLRWLIVHGSVKTKKDRRTPLVHSRKLVWTWQFHPRCFPPLPWPLSEIGKSAPR